MPFKNSKTQWGLSAILIHWIVAASVLGLFALGWWMTGLGYYDEWYKKGPDLHRSIGMLVFFVMLIRVSLRLLNPAPEKLENHKKWETQVASAVHLFLYGLLFLIMIAGYLISTADGRAVSIFEIIDIPATIQGIENQEDIAGAVHWYAACVLMLLVGLHALGALKHHFIDKDSTLLRMLGRKKTKND